MKLLSTILLTLITLAIALSNPHPTLAALWPAAVALTTILLHRQATLGLLAGALAGTLILAAGNPFTATIDLTQNHLFPSLNGPWHIGAILFTLILGAFTLVIEKSGTFETLAQKLLARKNANPHRRLEFTTLALGFLCFFDGLANSLLIGRITQPLADRIGVPRARMAYLVDSTSSSVACLAFISTWIATQLSLIQQSIENAPQVTTSAYTLFFQSIPNNFYCIFTLILAALTIWKQWNIGPIKNAKPTPPTKSKTPETPSTPHSTLFSLTPIITLSLSIIALFYLWETRPLLPITTEKISTAFSGNAGPYALTLGSIIGLLTACALFPKNRKNQLQPAILEGASSMLAPLLILILAWTFGSVLSSLNTATILAQTIGSSFPVNYIPAAIFLTGATISFLTGSSWGTMALLMPIAIPTYLDLAPTDPILLPATIGAVFSGAVFGDHCSPFSDTTIVSAFACGITPREHVLTQLPYALIAATTALLTGYTLIANNIHPLIAILTGATLLTALTIISTRKPQP